MGGKLNRKGIYIQYLLLLLLLVACGQRRGERVVTPWGEVLPTDGEAEDVLADTIPDDVGYDLDDIQYNGELIGLTLTGPETYYDYRGRHLGVQYLLCQRFAHHLGVRLRMEVCRDTVDMAHRLAASEADIICYPMSRQGVGWRFGQGKDDLRTAFDEWYRPQMLDEVRQQQERLLTVPTVQRRIFAPMLNRAGGVISHYDAYFQRYAPRIRWDWRLLAAQCYQESCFDPQARSWAGACGLMQLMPQTADHLGLARSDIYEPERNIEAAVRYIAELQQSFSDIPNAVERTKFVLAAYNGGGYHIRDAMALARSRGRDARRWRDVEPYVLGLQQAEYYNDPVVRNGYMRGSETVDYVRRILDRWNGYRGVKTTHSKVTAPSGIPQKAKRERKKKFQIDAFAN